jgi:nucleotide-binding universal stress UspA family protein
MIPLSSILVDIDATAVDHAALERAGRLAASSGGRLKIVDVLPDVPTSARRFVTAALEQELVDHRHELLTRAAERRARGTVTTEVLRGRPGLALIHDVLRSGHDLLVRSHGRERVESIRPFGAIDMELLRHCPCPVWLVGATQRTPSRVLAAIQADSPEQAGQDLNLTIMEWALTLKALWGCEVTLLHAWSTFGETVLRSRLPESEFVQYVEASRDAATAAMAAFRRPFEGRLADVAVEVVEGEPEDVITRFVRSHGIDVVVLGTVARTGIAGLVMGNTAERVLQRLRGSVLAVKPPGFVSPVTLTAR